MNKPQNASRTGPDHAPGTEPPQEPASSGEYVEGEDYYMDGPYFVFTAAFHRKRGYCCGSGCKHCPYGEEE